MMNIKKILFIALQTTIQCIFLKIVLTILRRRCKLEAEARSFTKHITATAMCINCNEVYHTLYALRIAGLTVIGKSNQVKCCFSKENGEDNDYKNNDSAMNIETYKRLVEAKDEIIKSKTDIIFQLKAKEQLLYKTLNILEEKQKEIGSRLTKNLSPNKEQISSSKQNKVQVLATSNLEISTKGHSDSDLSNNLGCGPNKNKEEERHNHTYASATNINNYNSAPNSGNIIRSQQLSRELQQVQTKVILNKYINSGEQTQGSAENTPSINNDGYKVIQRKKKKKMNIGKGEGDDAFYGKNEKDRKIWLFITKVPDNVSGESIKKFISTKTKGEKFAVGELLKEEDVEEDEDISSPPKAREILSEPATPTSITNQLQTKQLVVAENHSTTEKQPVVIKKIEVVKTQNIEEDKIKRCRIRHGSKSEVDLSSFPEDNSDEGFSRGYIELSRATVVISQKI
ncbi:unnamed protein product [Psylliodes chrysocephalus]|uniref:Uncharacterized protein n=1 Tax=Psylliodes chrysocephalus TaxID=3402493 RepID=A0A9P0GHK6_9CUCU|nr:unnamed protein product [Psylliodes chrysocephala]